MVSVGLDSGRIHLQRRCRGILGALAGLIARTSRPAKIPTGDSPKPYGLVDDRVGGLR
jgi:hypothetical protein